MKYLLSLLLIICVSFSGKAQEQKIEVSHGRKAVRTSGDVLAFATPVAG